MGTKKLTAIPTVSLCGPDVAYAPFGLEEVIKFNFLTSLRNYWAIRPLTLPFGLEEVIKFNFLTSLRKLWAILDLNQGPKDYESSALTAELMARILQRQSLEKYTLNKFLLSQTEYLEVWPELGSK